MKWNDAEAVMAKLEEAKPGERVYVVSVPPPDEPANDRTYAVRVGVGVDVGGEEMQQMLGIADDVGCDLTVSQGEDDPIGYLVAYFD